jgi:pyroglutamyl-peptidase
MRILLTGFEPFGGRARNSSAEVVERLAGAPPTGVDLATAILPVTFAGAWPALERAVRTHEPDAVVLLGQAAGRATVDVERVAINVAHTTAADNAGDAPEDRPLVAGGPDGRFATLPVRAIAEALHAEGIPAAVSNTAGTHVCNALLYLALQHLDVPVGFVHLPLLPAQALDGAHPTMALPTSAAAVAVALRTIAG